MNFAGKIVVVTGASSGIGVEIAKVFAKKSALLSMAGRNCQRLKETADECQKISGVRSLEITADLFKTKETKDIINKTVEKCSGLDVLINNAGIYWHKSIFEDDFMDTLDQHIQVDLKSALLMKEAAPFLVEKKGNIVNISSIAATVAVPNYSAYCTAKAGLDHLSRCIAFELATKGVFVNVVSPGPTITDSLIKSPKNSDKQMKQMEIVLASIIPLQKPATGIENAELVAFIASDKARSITGGIYALDSGCGIKELHELMKMSFRNNND